MPGCIFLYFSSMAIKNIIFDYGGVIFDIDHGRTSKAFEELGLKDGPEFFGHGGQVLLFDEFERGAISAAEFRARIRAHFDKPVTDAEIDDAWSRMLIGIPEGNLELLMKIKAKYRTFLLSNNNALHYIWIMKYLEREFQLEEGMRPFFEKDYYSHQLGMRKPHKEIFQFVLGLHQLDPAETLFIDDSSQHIETAEKMGIQVYLKDPKKPLAKVLDPYL